MMGIGVMRSNIIFLGLSLILLCQSCYPTIPTKPPCFEDGTPLEQRDAPDGPLIVKRCCLTADDCIERFTILKEEGTLKATLPLINRFAQCEGLSDDDLSGQFEDLNQEYGTCVLNLTSNNAQCRIGSDCSTSERCCPQSGDLCKEQFEDDSVISCTLCQEVESCGAQ